ncbi:extracellular calcium-sensing receptor-like [Anneissia japonica]|uniref:extracellular calcium-sensing receptor-like n=1 Tax=Anneissia japonica TaxID=1529436 RepID=UPI0014256750|nr:extracellular calcium-sensing receptor-like [Anneissia japonica]
MEDTRSQSAELKRQQRERGPAVPNTTPYTCAHSKVWIASDGWADISTHFYNYSSVASVLGVTISRKPLPNLFDHLAKYNTIRKHNSLHFLENFMKWMCDNKILTEKNCSDEILCKAENNNKTITLIESAAKTYLQLATNYEAYTTYIAVYAIAQALKDIQECSSEEGHLDECPDINNLDRWQLVTYLEKVGFSDNLGSSFQFSEDRQTNPSYIILNGKRSKDGTFELVEVGSYKHGKLDIDNSSIYWGSETYKGNKPLAICNNDCKPGTRRQYIENEQKCCFSCLLCSVNTITDIKNADTCMVCGQDQYANNNRTICLKKSPDVIMWNNTISVIVCIFSVLGSLTTIAVAYIFYKYRSTPIVKAASLSHTFVLAFVLFLSFQMVYFYIGIPTDTLCKVKSIINRINLTVILGIFCSKLYVIVKIVNNRLNSIPTKLFYRYSWMLVAAIACLHLAFNVILEIAIPSHVVYDYNNSLTILPIFCKETDVGFIVTNIYQLILSLICFIFSFRARNLPRNFQETRFIWFIMFTWCILEIFSFPAHFAAAPKLQICLQVIFISLFNFLTLSAFYFPKCYFIYFRPDKNTRENVGKEILKQGTSKPSKCGGVEACTTADDDASLCHEL